MIVVVVVIIVVVVVELVVVEMVIRACTIADNCSHLCDVGCSVYLAVL